MQYGSEKGGGKEERERDRKKTATSGALKKTGSSELVASTECSRTAFPNQGVHAATHRGLISFPCVPRSSLPYPIHLGDTALAQTDRDSKDTARLIHATSLEADKSSAHSTASASDPITAMEKPSSSKTRALHRLFVNKSGRPLYFCISKEVQDAAALQLRIEVTEWKRRTGRFILETME